MDCQAFDVLKMQYAALREECMQKLRNSDQLGYYKVLAIGAILGVAIANDRTQSPYLHSIFIVAMLLPMAFDAALYLNGDAILKIGAYVRTNIEPSLKTSIPGLQDIKLWEEHIAGSDSWSRLQWSLFEAIQPALTIALQLLIISRLEEKETLLVTVGQIAIGLEVILVLAAVGRTGKGLGLFGIVGDYLRRTASVDRH